MRKHGAFGQLKAAVGTQKTQRATDKKGPDDKAFLDCIRET
jgi:hypothetical protein